MSDHAELIEQLREAARYPNLLRRSVCPRMNKAAGLLEALVAENARLREALKPFAAEYDYWVKDVPAQLMLSDGEGTCSPADIPWEAIVRARAALAQDSSS